MGQKSVYVRNRDDPIWRKVEKIAKDKNIPQSQVVMEAIKFYFREGLSDEM